MSSRPLDILILGATGVTGRLTAAYLAKHPERTSLTFGISGRSKSKLTELAKELGEPDLPTFVVDATNAEDVERVVQNARVVINTVGPFWKYAFPVLEVCLKHQIHHLDFGGDDYWLGKLVQQYDYAAMQAGVILLPACAYFCLPSDVAVYLGHRTLERAANEHVDIDSSITAYEAALSVSGGTFGSLLAGAEELANVSPWRVNYPLSPVVGPVVPERLTYQLDIPEESSHMVGTTDLTQHANRVFIQRSWGLRELAARTDPLYGHYGPTFKYGEFTIRNRIIGLMAAGILSFFIRFISFGAFRWLARALGPKPGDGPSPSAIKNGWFKLVNVTTSVPSSSKPLLRAKTVIEGKGDPGYLLSAHMIAEAALCIVLHADSLPPFGRRGGVLTPTTALGDVLVERLKKAGFGIESKIIS